MKLDTDFGTAVKPDGFEEKYFSIENPAMVFDILRKKIYSDPILAVCREYMCNALDAHREVGTPEKPIQVKLPTYDDLYFVVKDFGPGISPDRMENVFVKYTASTKRDDNNQIGGFGLGGKAAFAYSDSFNINTVHNGKKYNYICFIDQSKIGKLTLISEFDTDEDNGTEIIIPVASSIDIGTFVNRVEFVGRHWKVKPETKNGNVSWQTRSKVVSGDRWYISDTSGYGSYVKIILENIEYSIPFSTLFSNIKSSNRGYYESPIRGELCLEFNTGELSLSVNREQLFMDDKTKQAISERANVAWDQIKDNIKSGIENCSSYIEACVKLNKYHEAFNDVKEFAENLSFNGTLLTRNAKPEGVAVVYTKKNSHFYSSYKSRNGISYSKKNVVPLYENTLFVVNDINVDRVSSAHVNKIWETEKNPSIAVIDASNFDDEDFVSKFEVRKLSSYCKINNKQKKEYVKTTVFKVYRDEFIKCNISDYELVPSANKYVCRKNTNYSLITKSGRVVSLRDLKRAFPGDYTVFAIESSSDEKVEKLTLGVSDVDQLIDDKLNQYSDNEIAMKKYYSNINFGYLFKSLNKLKSLVGKDGTAFTSLYDMLLTARDVQNDDNFCAISKFSKVEAITEQQYNSMVPGGGYEVRLQKFNETYPLLNHIFSQFISYWYEDLSKLESVAHYINLVDGKTENNKGE